jgi:hypothetical protein
MALHYCSTHHRLLAMPHQRWTEVPAALIARINALYQRVPLPDFEVIAAPCDQCDQGETVAEQS